MSGPAAEQALLADRVAASARLDALLAEFDGIVRASAESNADDEHDPEGATIGFERAQVLALVQQTRQHLAELDEALARAHDGSYGRCEVCGNEIPAARLEARPSARTCVGCAARPR